MKIIRKINIKKIYLIKEILLRYFFVQLLDKVDLTAEEFRVLENFYYKSFNRFIKARKKNQILYFFVIHNH